MNAVIACGGTGGHLFPGIAVAEVLRDRGHEVMLLVSEKDIDALALSGRANFRVEKLPTVGLPSPFSPAFFGFLRRFHRIFSGPPEGSMPNLAASCSPSHHGSGHSLFSREAAS